MNGGHDSCFKCTTSCCSNVVGRTPNVSPASYATRWNSVTRYGCRSPSRLARERRGSMCTEASIPDLSRRRPAGPGPVVLGLVGPAGSGKSTVARAWAAEGARVLDADRIGHEVTDSDSDVRRALA